MKINFCFQKIKVNHVQNHCSYVFDASYVSFSIKKALLEGVSSLLFTSACKILSLKGYLGLHCKE